MTAARLVLEGGSIWHGLSFGASGTRLGEVVFSTSMSGYREIITAPSCAGQIIVMTWQHWHQSRRRYSRHADQRTARTQLARTLPIESLNQEPTYAISTARD